MLYTTTITTASLRLRESRVIATLLLEGVQRSGLEGRVARTQRPTGGQPGLHPGHRQVAARTAQAPRSGCGPWWWRATPYSLPRPSPPVPSRTRCSRPWASSRVVSDHGAPTMSGRSSVVWLQSAVRVGTGFVISVRWRVTACYVLMDLAATNFSAGRVRVCRRDYRRIGPNLTITTRTRKLPVYATAPEYCHLGRARAYTRVRSCPTPS